jgi:hypothetical protein
MVASALLVSLIWWPHGLGGRNHVASSKKTLACHWYSSRIDCSVLTFVLLYAFSAICCVMVVFRICSPWQAMWMLSHLMIVCACLSSVWRSVMFVQCHFCGSAMSLLAIRTCFCTICLFAAVMVTSSVPLRVPVVQLIWGLKLQSHGWLRIIQSFLRFVTKNLTHCSFCPRVT